jgi:hypothetical protein
MKDAANELGNDQSEEIHQFAVSCDGTWQRQRHSLNGCVTTLSMENGKSLVEVLNKVCLGCQRIELEMMWERKL